jgi:hypothetical protein
MNVFSCGVHHPFIRLGYDAVERHILLREIVCGRMTNVTRRGYVNQRRLFETDGRVPSGNGRNGALMSILMSMGVGCIVLALTLLVFWVLSQFNPLGQG